MKRLTSDPDRVYDNTTDKMLVRLVKNCCAVYKVYFK